MSFGDIARPQHLGPDRLNPVSGTPILRASVEAKRVSDLCTAAVGPNGARDGILRWLADGAREVTWALCSLPRAYWAEAPPGRVSDWPALRHARHLALRETHLTLPSVRHALGDVATATLPSNADLEHVDAAWDPSAAIESAEAIVTGLGDTRFEMLQRLEAAPDEAWQRPLPSPAGEDTSGFDKPIQLDWLMLHARQHELEHLAAIWRVALYWDRVSPPTSPLAGVPLHPADRPEESN
jgi:hypothetical protein